MLCENNNIIIVIVIFMCTKHHKREPHKVVNIILDIYNHVYKRCECQQIIIQAREETMV